jgi:TRAP-type mannitol/chloroaromatic compound transport system permease small subunit
VLAIFATLFCCFPFGIVAIVYATQVNAKFHAGDVAGAEEASRQASLWGWITFGFGLVAWVGYLLAVNGAPFKP